MRVKIASAKSSRGPLDVKIGAGHQQDIELFAQCGTLLDATAPRDVAGGLAAFGQAQMLSSDQVRALSDAYDLFWATQLGGRLLMDDLADFDQLGPDGCDFMVKLSRSKDKSDMVNRLSDAQRGASELISTGLAKLREAGS